MHNNEDIQVEIQFRGQGEHINTWNQTDHELREQERGLIALREDKPIGTLVWSAHDAHEGPQAWLKQRYVYLHSAWIHPQHRGRGVIAALAEALRNKYPVERIHGTGPGATLVTAFLNSRSQ